MAILPGKCLLPQLMEERNLRPYDVYTHPEIDMSRSQFSDYYTGRKKMSIGMCKLFANFFGVPMDDIYEWIQVASIRKKGSRDDSE